MEPRTRLGKLLAYLLLLAGSFLFLFPFIWMVSTSLKPIEQTTKTPPQWIPLEYHAFLAGQRRPVIKADPLTVPMLVIRIDEGPLAGAKQLVGSEDYADGKVKIMTAGQAHWVAATLLKEAQPGWSYVKERLVEAEIDAPAEWDVLPPDQIEVRQRLFWENYPVAIQKMGHMPIWIPFLGQRDVSVFWVYLSNTLVVCILGVTGTVISSSLVAYSLAKIPWSGRHALFGLTLATMMIPFPVLMVPLYSVFKAFGWIGTLLPLWVPAFFGTGFNIFLLRQFFLTIPRDLSEAARIDGCSEFGIFWRIVLPLSKPALAVVALFHFLWAWNDFMGPLLYLTRQETFTLSLGLQAYQSQSGGTDWTSLMAASTLICLPIIVIFFFTQKTFIRGIATTGIKG